MAGHDIIVIGASAGGVEAFSRIIEKLPAELPAAIFLVLHIPAQVPSVLPSILGRVGHLPAFHALEGAKIEYGHIYIAPPDHHLLVEQGHMHVVRGPKENRHRPAIDPLFRSASNTYGPRVIGVILTGALDDGTAGLIAIKRRGGLAVVQDPDEAMYPGMPRSAVENAKVDYVLKLDEIASTLVRLVAEPAPDDTVYPVLQSTRQELDIVEMNPNALHSDNHPGTPSAFSCPECGGVLWELQEDGLLRFRCRVGHAFSTESIEAEQDEALEEALWMALKTLEENASLNRRLSEQAQVRGHYSIVSRYNKRVEEALKRAETIRQVLIRSDAHNSQPG